MTRRFQFGKEDSELVPPNGNWRVKLHLKTGEVVPEAWYDTADQYFYKKDLSQRWRLDEVEKWEHVQTHPLITPQMQPNWPASNAIPVTGNEQVQIPLNPNQQISTYSMANPLAGQIDWRDAFERAQQERRAMEDRTREAKHRRMITKCWRTG